MGISKPNEGDHSSWVRCVKEIATPKAITKFSVLYKLMVLACLLQGCNNDMPENVDPSTFLGRTECADKECGAKVYHPGGGEVEDVPSEFFETIEAIPDWARPLLETDIAINSELCDDPDIKCGKVVDNENRLWYNLKLSEWCGEDPEDPDEDGYIGDLNELAEGDGAEYVVDEYDEDQVFGDDRCIDE